MTCMPFWVVNTPQKSPEMCFVSEYKTKTRDFIFSRRGTDGGILS